MGKFSELGLITVINGSGKMTALGASAVAPSVAEAMGQAAMDYVDIEEMMAFFGQEVAKHTGAEDGCPTIGAAAGVAISVAACISGKKISLIERIPNTEGLRNEVIIQKGHCIHFGGSIEQMITIGGGVVKSVGAANKVTAAHIEEAITENTAALMYIKSHHAVQKGMASIEDMLSIGEKHKIPVIIDAAAEEDLRKYIDMGADAVIYSGGKAIEGPTSGFIAGKKDFMESCRMQYKGVGRAMKVSKEAMVGLLTALRNYENRSDNSAEQMKRMRALCNQLAGLDEVSCEIKQDEAGRAIYRAAITLKKTAPMTALELNKMLQTGNPSIYLRDHYANVGTLYVDPRPLLDGQVEIIAQEIIRLLTKET
ncbi:MAG: DgaE family pyridoxal phosphate-dependent ammonia lyase [Bacilli bacterium]